MTAPTRLERDYQSVSAERRETGSLKESGKPNDFPPPSPSRRFLSRGFSVGGSSDQLPCSVERRPRRRILSAARPMRAQLPTTPNTRITIIFRTGAGPSGRPRRRITGKTIALSRISPNGALANHARMPVPYPAAETVNPCRRPSAKAAAIASAKPTPTPVQRMVQRHSAGRLPNMPSRSTQDQQCASKTCDGTQKYGLEGCGIITRACYRGLVGRNPAIRRFRNAAAWFPMPASPLLSGSSRLRGVRRYLYLRLPIRAARRATTDGGSACVRVRVASERER